VPASTAGVVAFVAALADGRACLSFDREGEARLTLILAQPEAAKLAAKLPVLMDTSFAVALKPLR
jgi:hypothetical protein